MTSPKRTNTTLRRMIERRDKKIADLTNENADARAELVNAVRQMKQLAQTNAMLRNNIEVLQRPDRAVHRKRRADKALAVLSYIKAVMRDYEKGN